MDTGLCLICIITHVRNPTNCIASDRSEESIGNPFGKVTNCRGDPGHVVDFSCTSTKRSNHSWISNFCAIIFELMNVVLASSWICRHFPSLNGYCPCAVKWMSDRWRWHCIFSKRIGVPWVYQCTAIVDVHAQLEWYWISSLNFLCIMNFLCTCLSVLNCH
jgi:hypothetical protein